MAQRLADRVDRLQLIQVVENRSLGTIQSNRCSSIDQKAPQLGRPLAQLAGGAVSSGGGEATKVQKSTDYERQRDEDGNKHFLLIRIVSTKLSHIRSSNERRCHAERSEVSPRGSQRFSLRECSCAQHDNEIQRNLVVRAIS